MKHHFYYGTLLSLVIITLFVKTSVAQDDIAVSIGGSYFAPLEIESDNANSYLEAHVYSNLVQSIEYSLI